jgi:hypothetical protein
MGGELPQHGQAVIGFRLKLQTRTLAASTPFHYVLSGSRSPVVLLRFIPDAARLGRATEALLTLSGGFVLFTVRGQLSKGSIKESQTIYQEELGS